MFNDFVTNDFVIVDALVLHNIVATETLIWSSLKESKGRLRLPFGCFWNMSSYVTRHTMRLC